MILRAISISGWRCFIETIKVGPFEEGLNIIYGPNGTGKSTLFEAFRRALLDGHRVTGKEVEALRPWGRVLGPKVSVEFFHGGFEYRISKQFLDNPDSVLERKEDGRFRRLAEGAAADEQTRTIITKNSPGRGFARLENWGLAQVLWVPQGNLVLQNLSGDLVTDIRSMLTTQVGGTAPIERKIEERFLEFFTPKGKLRTGKDAPLIAKLQQELKEAEDARRKALDAYLEFEESARKIEDLRARRAQTKHDEAELLKVIKETRKRVEIHRTLRSEREQRLERVKATEAQHQELQQRIAAITNIEKELLEARKTSDNLEKEAPLRTRERQGREIEATKAKTALEDARKGRMAVEEAEQLAETARRFCEYKKTFSDLSSLIEKIKKAENKLADRKQERNKLVAPDAKILRAVRKTINERDEARLRIEASLITLEIVPKKDARMEILAGESTGPQSLQTGVPAQVQGSPEVIADLPGIARLRAWGPTGSIEEHRETYGKAETKLKELTEPYGTSDPDLLENLGEKARELEKGVAEANTQILTMLSGKSMENLSQGKGIQEAALVNILEGHPDWGDSPPNVQEMKSRAEDTKRAFIAAVESAEATWERAQSALMAATGQEQTTAQRLTDTRKVIISLENKLADLTRDGKQPQEREKELQRITMAWDAARGGLEKIDNQLAEFQEDPAAALEKLEAQMEAANKLAERAREEEIREEARLEGLSAQGTYSVLASAEERLVELRQEVKNEELRVEAIRFLWETMVTCRTEAIAVVTQPVEAAATRILQRIASRRLGRICVGENFEPCAVVPDTLEESVTLENLSGGEKEQLYLATRLALAEVLRRGERHLVVLDDVLTATDSGRLARVLNVLEEAAQRLQVLILTCHPERYRGLKTGHFFDLENIQKE
jgi:energy-coupling factor transporter ATP-binding protein EcfA2